MGGDLVEVATHGSAADRALREGADADLSVELAAQVHRAREARGDEADRREDRALELDLVAPVQPQRPEHAQRVDERRVERDEEGRVAQPLARQEHGHELRLLVIDVAEGQLADRLRELEVHEHRERVVAVLPPVPEDGGREQTLLDHRLDVERAGEVVALDGGVVAVQHQQLLDGVELVVERPGEHVAHAGVDPERDHGRRVALEELVVEGELLVEVGRAGDLARPAGAHVEVVPAGVETGLHHGDVPRRRQGIEDEVRLLGRRDQRRPVRRIHHARRRLARRQLRGHVVQAALVDVGQDHLVHRGFGGGDPRRDLTDRPDAELQYAHVLSSCPQTAASLTEQTALFQRTFHVELTHSIAG